MKKIISIVLLIATTSSTHPTMFSEFINTHATKLGFFGIITVFGAYVVRTEVKLNRMQQQQKNNADQFSQKYSTKDALVISTQKLINAIEKLRGDLHKVTDQLPSYLKTDALEGALKSSPIIMSCNEQLNTHKNKINEMIDSAALVFDAKKGLVPTLNAINDKLGIENSENKAACQILTNALKTDKIISKLQ